MALSMPPEQNPWDRTLPNPALLPHGIDTRRSSSLLQHHISSDQFQTPAADESGRRATLPCLPRYKEGEGQEQESLRQRRGSVMSSHSITESSSEGTSPTDHSGLCICRPEPKIPRPRNAFILYRQHQHSAVVAQNPGLPNPDISKIIGEQWRQLSPKEKSEWQALAEQEKARHSQQFPDYRYRPKRNGRFQPGDITPTQSSSCTKCGGKTMNFPNTAHYAPYETHHPAVVSVARPAKRPYTESRLQPPPRGSVITQLAPRTAPVPVRYAYGPPAHQRHDSVQYVRAPPPAAHYVAVEGPGAKRRRLDTYGARPSYDHAQYDRGPAPAPYHAEQGPRHAMPPPARLSVAAQPSPATPTRPSALSQPRRDPSLTLPPLQTSTPGRPTGSPKPQALVTQSDIENMIMSYPVLTKLKTLHSITPIASNNGASKSNRGTIIAVEGLDPQLVMDMTHSLADQLDKDGNFLVKVFTGPDPYPALHNRRASLAQGGDAMTTEKYLNIMSIWHQISKDVKAFIATGHSVAAEDPAMIHASNPEVAKAKSPFDRPQSERSPISAVSPGTRTENHVQPQSCQSDQHAISSASPSSRSRIPAPPSELIVPEQRSPTPSPPATPEMIRTSRTAMDIDDSKPLIPIAIIPHYQLTTVDACSLALPITDNYDSLTHWRWHATLWRGCVGPDISIVIQSAHDQREDDALADHKRPGPLDNERRMSGVAGLVRPSDMAPSGVPPVSTVQTTAPALAPLGVEVRLNDHRAVVVRVGHLPRANASDAKDVELEIEKWEKAKRRVGFEVEESLRR